MKRRKWISNKTFVNNVLVLKLLHLPFSTRVIKPNQTDIGRRLTRRPAHPTYSNGPSAQLAERIERERTERPERPERADRPERPERQERSERMERVERPAVLPVANRAPPLQHPQPHPHQPQRPPPNPDLTRRPLK